MSKIGSPVFGNAFQDFEHEIVEENSEFSHLKSDKDMSRAEMEEIEEDAQEENYDQHEMVANLDLVEENWMKIRTKRSLAYHADE